MRREKMGLPGRCALVVAAPLMAVGLLVVAALIYGFSLKGRNYTITWRDN